MAWRKSAWMFNIAVVGFVLFLVGIWRFYGSAFVLPGATNQVFCHHTKDWIVLVMGLNP